MLEPPGDPSVGRKLYVDKIFSGSRVPLDYFNIGDFQLTGSRVFLYEATVSAADLIPVGVEMILGPT